MAKKYTAQGACGAIRFAFNTHPTFIAVCRCLDCKQSASRRHSSASRRIQLFRGFLHRWLVGRGQGAGRTGEPMRIGLLPWMHSSPNAEIDAPMAWTQCLTDRTRATHPSRLVMLSVIGLAITAMQASAAVAAARKNAGGCGEYRYYRAGRCVDARGSDAGPPSHWHPYDPSNSRSGGR